MDLKEMPCVRRFCTDDGEINDFVLAGKYHTKDRGKIIHVYLPLRDDGHPYEVFIVEITDGKAVNALWCPYAKYCPPGNGPVMGFVYRTYFIPFTHKTAPANGEN